MPNVAINEMIRMTAISIAKCRKEVAPISAFSVMKLKNRTPKISDRLLSYVTNSFSFDAKFLTLGIAIELLMIASGIALASPTLRDTLPKC
jgi:hypothetical protein